jgi:hypothetical protein
VAETTQRIQIPELSISLIGEFYLTRLDISLKAEPLTSDLCADASDHWRSAEAIGTIAVFEDHIARFPNCPFAGLAKARIAALAPPSALSPATDVRRFDGFWIAKVACEGKAPIVPASSYQFTATVKDGVLHAQTGVEGKPGSQTYNGKTGPDGTAEIFITGFAGQRDPFHRPIGTEYRTKVASRFEGSHGAGIRADRRNCNFDFAKLTLPAAGLKQVDAPVARTSRPGQRSR